MPAAVVPQTASPEPVVPHAAPFGPVVPALPGEVLAPVYVPVGPVAGHPGYPAPGPYGPPTQPGPPTYDPSRLPYLPPGMPFSAVPMYPPSGGRKVAVIVLSVLLGLFVVSSGALGILYVQKNTQSAELSENVADLEGRNTVLERERDAAERNLRDSDAELEDRTTERDAIADCLSAIYAWWEALAATNNVDTPETDAALEDAQQACDEADRYL